VGWLLKKCVCILDVHYSIPTWFSPTYSALTVFANMCCSQISFPPPSLILDAASAGLGEKTNFSFRIALRSLRRTAQN
jgi:hypothetical protein